MRVLRVPGWLRASYRIDGEYEIKINSNKVNLPLPPSLPINFRHPRIRKYPTVQKLHHVERRPNHALVLTQHYRLGDRDDLVWKRRGRDVVFMKGVKDRIFTFDLVCGT